MHNKGHIHVRHAHAREDARHCLNIYPANDDRLIF